MVRPSQSELDRRKLVEFTAETVNEVSSNEYPQYYPDEDHSWNIDDFKQSFHIKIHESSPLDSTFSLIGIDASIANAFRRILLAEVPTLAIEHVYITNNTSIVQDEVLAARLGLIPLKGSKKGLNWMKWIKKGTEGNTESVLSDYNTAVLHLDVECTWKADGRQKFKAGETDPNQLYNNSNVYAKMLAFQPSGRQEEFFSGPDAIQPVHPDILIAKLRPGQCIKLTMHCNKGIGADHAKFSPVATASYRLLPNIEILKPILGQEAKKFARCFPRGVIKLEPVTQAEAREEGSAYEDKEGELKAVVADPMKDTVSRECLRHEEFVDKVRLSRIRDHFIFKVESTGQFESEELFIESVKLLKAKCARMKRSLGELTGGTMQE